MYQRRTGSYDEIPEGMKRYINNYGCHFNKKLCDWAISRMYKKDASGKKTEHIRVDLKNDSFKDMLTGATGKWSDRNKKT